MRGLLGKVFISYRRDDSAGHAGRVHDRLANEFGRDLLFMDVDAIPLGVNFVKTLRDEVAKCEVLLAIIGRNWLDASDDDGNRRLNNVNDFVRVEIGAALRRDIPVIPILLDGACVPKIDQLPVDLADLATRNGLDVRHASFHSDMDKLIRGLKERLRRVPEEPQARQRAEEQRRKRGGEVEQPQKAVAKGARRAEQERKRKSEEDQPRKTVAKSGPRAKQERKSERAAKQARKGTAKPALNVKEKTREARGEISIEVGLPGRSKTQSFVAGAGRTEWFKDFDRGPEMVVVPAGWFMMGSPESEQGRGVDEGPQHKVTFQRPFAIGRFAVAFEQWDACAADGGCDGYRPNDNGWGRGHRPVINVSWKDAKAYVEWLANKTGKPYRLLSEAEWEYAARAGTTTAFWWGDSICKDQANYDSNHTYPRSSNNSPLSGLFTAKRAKGDHRRRTVPVNSFNSNRWGLYQVHGNVAEWTEDCYNNSYHGAPTDGSVLAIGNCTRRVLRGGSWNHPPQLVRAAHRDGITADLRIGDFGFRVGRTLAP